MAKTQFLYGIIHLHLRDLNTDIFVLGQNFQQLQSILQISQEKYFILDRLRSKGYRCVSGISLFKWQNTWKYAYSPFNIIILFLHLAEILRGLDNFRDKSFKIKYFQYFDKLDELDSAFSNFSFEKIFWKINISPVISVSWTRTPGSV